MRLTISFLIIFAIGNSFANPTGRNGDGLTPQVVARAIEADPLLASLQHTHANVVRSIVEAQQAGRTCPDVWKEISRELTGMFRDGDECNTSARTAIRTALHDCIPWKPGEPFGGCDGSLFLANEFMRRENLGVDRSAVRLGNLARQFNVGVGDMFQFAAAHAVVTCPLGPRVRTFVGRQDSSRAEPEGRIPKVLNSADDLINLFLVRGFTPSDLSALVGAHSTSRQFFIDANRRGQAQDTTPGIWDVAFYGETLNRTAPFIFESDIKISQDPRTGPSFRAFVENQRGWNFAFENAMSKLSLQGVNGGSDGLVECTSALPHELQNIRVFASNPDENEEDE